MTDEHKTKKMGSALGFLSQYEEEGDGFTKIVTGTETWVFYVNIEQQSQSMEWCHTSSPQRPVKCRKTLVIVCTYKQCWLYVQAVEFYWLVIDKLVPRYDNCLNVNGNYV